MGKIIRSEMGKFEPKFFQLFEQFLCCSNKFSKHTMYWYFNLYDNKNKEQNYINSVIYFNRQLLTEKISKNNTSSVPKTIRISFFGFVYAENDFFSSF